MLRQLFCILFCGLWFLTNAQTVAPVFENINVDNGLSQSSVYGIFQDSKGYMWFSTADGINRYDGTETKSYKLKGNVLHNKPNAMFIRGKMVEGPLGNIWFANATGVYYYERSSDLIKIALSFDKTPYRGMWAGVVCIDNNNNLWLPESYLGLLTYNIVSKKLHYYKYPLNNIEPIIKVNRLFFADQGNRYLWFSRDKTEGIFRFDIATKKADEFFKGKGYVSMAFYRQKMILVSPNAIDLYTKDFKLERTIALPTFNQPTSLANNLVMDNHNRLWISIAQEGIFCYDFTTQKFTQYKNEPKLHTLSSNLTTILYLDNTNNLWIGTDGGGVCKLDIKPPLFNIFPNHKDLLPLPNNHFTKCFYEDEKQRIWFGTANDGFGIYNPKTGALKMIKHTLDGKPITNVGSIFKDSRGNLWIGYTDGFAIFNESTGYLQPIKINNKPKQEIPHAHFVYKITELKNKQVLGATKIGLIKFNQQKDGTFVGERLSSIFEFTNSITDIVAFKPNEILFSTEFNGMYHAKLADGKFSLIKGYLNNNKISSLLLDSKIPQTLWVGTETGLIKFNMANQQYTIYAEQAGLKNTYIYGVLEDKTGHLWLSTNAGISSFDKQQHTFVNYTHKNGLQSNEFNSGAYYQSASGLLYFGGINGFNWFSPIQALQKKILNKPNVTITSLTLNDSVYIGMPTGTLKFPYWKNQLSFELAILDYTLPQANQMQYQLVGADKEMLTSHVKTIRYHNLTPGNYTLKFRGINGYNAISDITSLNIVIRPPFWRTWAFYVGIGMVTIGILVWITKRISYQKLKKRIEELERQQLLEKERQRIGREMHDDIAAGLTQINMMSRLVANNRTNAHEHELLEIAETSNKLISNMSDIIWNLNNPLNFVDFIAHLRERLHKLLEHTNINYQLNLPHITHNSTILNPEKQRNLMLITQEIVPNAIKHSEAKNIEVKLITNHNKLVFTIQDDGKGCDLANVKNGNGLKNIHYRIQQINGKISITNKVNGGCKFVYEVMLG